MMRYFDEILLRENRDNFSQSDIKRMIKELAQGQDKVEKENYEENNENYQDMSYIYKKLLA